jgi:hypothetical protein
MTRYSDSYQASNVGDWVWDTARRNPEALLLLAAGCALLMRSGRSGRTRISTGVSRTRHTPMTQGSAKFSREAAEIGDQVSRTAGQASRYMEDVKDRMTETASAYADRVSEFADESRRQLYARSSAVRSTIERVLRDQPLAVVAAGLAAGAAVAAAFPVTDIENRALGNAHEAVEDLMDEAGKRVMGAAREAGERLKSVAEERGLTPEGFKDMASDVAGAFGEAVTKKKEGTHREPTTVPNLEGLGGTAGQGGTAPTGSGTGRSAR